MDGTLCAGEAKIDLSSWSFDFEGKPIVAAFTEALAETLDETPPVLHVGEGGPLCLTLYLPFEDPADGERVRWWWSLRDILFSQIDTDKCVEVPIAVTVRETAQITAALRHLADDLDRHVGAATAQGAAEPVTVGVREAAAMIGICKATAQKHINNGKLKTVRLGGRTLVTVASIRALADAP